MQLDSPRIRSRLDLLYAVTREFNAGLDINQVLDRVLFTTLAAVGVSDASLFLFDSQGELENFFLINNFDLEKYDRPTLEAVLDKGLAGWIKKHRQGVIIKDTGTDERWYTYENGEQFRRAGSAVGVPIQIPGQLIGILTMTASRPNFFDESDLSMLTIMADQAAFAIANARLFEAEQHRHRFADTLTSIARTINSTLNLKEVLNLILEQLALVVDYDSASILLFEEEDRLAVRAARAFEDMEDALNVTIRITENSPNYQAIAQRKPVAIANVDDEPNWIKTSSTRNVHSWIGAPLIARNQVVGMLTVDSHQINKYTEENTKEVAAFADLVAVVVANAQTVTHLRNAEASYTALFEDSTDMIVITTYQGLILNLNRKACRILEQTKEALINSDISLIDPRLEEYLIQQTKHLKASKEVCLELDIVNQYKQTTSLELRARQVHYSGQDCVQWVGRDISARKEAERLRQDLLDMVIHDMRGPIGNLINSIELLPMVLDTDDPAALNRLLKIAQQSTQEVRDLVDSMLDVRRLEQGEVLLQEEWVDIGKVIQMVERQVRPRASAKSMELTVDTLPEMPPMWMDGGMIRRVLINLLDNALKYTPSDGKVALTVTQSGDTLTVAVSDNGPGISQADQTRIFDKFSRVNQSKNGPSGVGLGLAFCKLAAEAHKGSISVESEGVPGQGSTFYLSLPIISEPLQ